MTTVQWLLYVLVYGILALCMFGLIRSTFMGARRKDKQEQLEKDQVSFLMPKERKSKN